MRLSTHTHTCWNQRNYGWIIIDWVLHWHEFISFILMAHDTCRWIACIVSIIIVTSCISSITSTLFLSASHHISHLTLCTNIFFNSSEECFGYFFSLYHMLTNGSANYKMRTEERNPSAKYKWEKFINYCVIPNSNWVTLPYIKNANIDILCGQQQHFRTNDKCAQCFIDVTKRKRERRKKQIE